jgi:hypothetical protein
MTSHKLFPSTTLVVRESEASDYQRFDLKIVTIPDEVAGISAVRNWIPSRFGEEAVVMLEDDITACVCMVSLRCRKLSPDETLAMIENAAWCARGPELVNSAGCTDPRSWMEAEVDLLTSARPDPSRLPQRKQLCHPVLRRLWANHHARH